MYIIDIISLFKINDDSEIILFYNNKLNLISLFYLIKHISFTITNYFFNI